MGWFILLRAVYRLLFWSSLLLYVMIELPYPQNMIASIEVVMMAYVWVFYGKIQLINLLPIGMQRYWFWIHKNYLIREVKRSNSPLAYLVLAWIEFDLAYIFEEEGFLASVRASNAKLGF